MPRESQASDKESPDDSDFIELTGCATRSDWEDLYLATRQLAKKHGLSVELFELEPTQVGDSETTPERVVDAHEATAGSE